MSIYVLGIFNQYCTYTPLLKKARCIGHFVKQYQLKHDNGKIQTFDIYYTFDAQP